MKRLTLLTALFFALIASAGAVPEGYMSSRLILPNPPGTLSGVYTVDSNNTLYYSHSPVGKSMFDVKMRRSTGSQIWIYDQNNGTHGLFYSSPASNPGDFGINSVTGIVIDETTTPWTYYIADQEPEKGNPWGSGGIWIAQDLTGSGTILDPGDRVELYTTDLSLLVYISDMIRNHATGDIYVTNADGIAGNPMVYRLRDDNYSGTIESHENHPYALLPGDFDFVGGLCFGLTNNVIFTHDTSGSIYRLEDLNSDGDAFDPGETTLFASLPINGGYHIGIDTDHHLFVTASDWSTMTHAIYQISIEAVPEVTLFYDLSGDVGFIGNFVISGSGSFEPGQNSDAIMYLSYTTSGWSDPDELIIVKPVASSTDVPTTGTAGLIALLIGLGCLLRKR